MPQVKVRSDRQVRIPASMFSKYGLRDGDILDVCDIGNGIVLIPKSRKQKLTKEYFFEIVEKIWTRNRNIDSRALDRVIDRAVRTVRAEERKTFGGYAEFAAEDRKLAEDGMAEYMNVVKKEDSLYI